MLGILLTILKIIGIIILCILGFVLGIILIVLFLPIRYEAQGEIYEEYNIKIKVHWFVHLLHVVVQLKNKIVEVNVRILGKKLLSIRKGSEEEHDGNSKEIVAGSDSEQKSEKTSAKERKEEDSVEQTKEILKEESDKTLEETLKIAKEEVADDRIFSEKLKDKLDKIVDKIADKCEHLEKTIEDLQDKIENTKKTIYYYVNLVSHERTQSFLKRLWKEMVGIFTHIAPRKLKVNFHIGMDNPATTGQICMYASMLYPIYQDNIQIEPNFEEKVLEGTFSLKGRIRLGYFIAMVVRLIVNKDFLYVITHIKQKDEEETQQNKSKSR